ncbi:hypothetical protein BJV82DRAFT_574235 [Fennellomyces sp. T-0311]|nr:hypothetical protein BJV82DRAFT_574235 [Fennellomyces sp. T-0311]
MYDSCYISCICNTISQLYPEEEIPLEQLVKCLNRDCCTFIWFEKPGYASKKNLHLDTVKSVPLLQYQELIFGNPVLYKPTGCIKATGIDSLVSVSILIVASVGTLPFSDPSLSLKGPIRGRCLGQISKESFDTYMDIISGTNVHAYKSFFK